MRSQHPSPDPERIAVLEREIAELRRAIRDLENRSHAPEEFTATTAPALTIGPFYLAPSPMPAFWRGDGDPGPEIDVGILLKKFGQVFGTILDCKNREAFTQLCDAVKELCSQIKGQKIDLPIGKIALDTCTVDCDDPDVVKMTVKLTRPGMLGGKVTLFETTFTIRWADFDKFAMEVKKLKKTSGKQQEYF